MVDFKKLLRDLEVSSPAADTEPSVAAVPAPLDAKPLPGMQDWTRKVGVLYGVPIKLGGSWGVAIYPTVQQNALLEVDRRAACDRGDYSEDYLRGRAAVSVDSSGRSRSLMITDPRAGWRHDMYGNMSVHCNAVPRAVERAGVGADGRSSSPVSEPAAGVAAILSSLSSGPLTSAAGAHVGVDRPASVLPTSRRTARGRTR